ncbi:MAG: hypothetical protein A2993_04090 [Gammaproteobacteria bacterium RIFCSPLOWO2_01_FULL_47_190]|nr:MAG: hypothetical protein A2993_04090 [Gammaproteobacteria bacterium RIFCSPLOWO2_01_FULL_47_190]
MFGIAEYTRTIHIAFAVLTIISFTLRGMWMLMDSPLLLSKPARIVPHIIDTLLLFSGIVLVINYTSYHHGYGWLLAKLAAIILYIGTTVGIVTPRNRSKNGLSMICCITGMRLCSLSSLSGGVCSSDMVFLPRKIISRR